MRLGLAISHAFFLCDRMPDEGGMTPAGAAQAVERLNYLPDKERPVSLRRTSFGSASEIRLISRSRIAPIGSL
jgi:hypothetical protein